MGNTLGIATNSGEGKNKMAKKNKPTFNQKKAAQLIAEKVRKGEKIVLGDIMKEAGYSGSYSEQPSRLTESKAFTDLMDEYFPDKEILKKHKELFGAKILAHTNFHYKIKDVEIKKIIEEQGFTFIGTKRFMVTAVVFFTVPDTVTQDKALDKLYKLKGIYGAQKVQFVDENEEYSDEQLLEELARRDKFRKHKKESSRKSKE